MNIAAYLVVGGLGLCWFGPVRADGAGPPQAQAPLTLQGYTTTKAGVAYAPNAMTGYGSAGTGYSATAVPGYRVAPKVLPNAPMAGGGGQPVDADPLQAAASTRGARPAAPVVVNDRHGTVWVFDATLNGWRNRSTAAVRFSNPGRSPSPTDAGQPSWVASPDRPD